jgi:hypothetical protein
LIDLSKLTPADKRRFAKKVSKGNKCWGWLGSHKKKGYGRFCFQGHTVAAHRVAYFLSFGALDPHLEVDHLCRTRDCVNPAHLEAVCPALNRQRRIEAHRPRPLADEGKEAKIVPFPRPAEPANAPQERSQDAANAGARARSGPPRGAQGQKAQ